MNILTLPARNLRRKLMRTLALTVVFAVGISSVVALNYVSSAVGESMEKKLTAYGANIVLRPKVDTLDVGYGGFNLGSVSFGVKHLTQDQLDRVRTIALKDRIAAVAPKLIWLTSAPAGAQSPDSTTAGASPVTREGAQLQSGAALAATPEPASAVTASVASAPAEPVAVPPISTDPKPSGDAVAIAPTVASAVASAPVSTDPALSGNAASGAPAVASSSSASTPSLAVAVIGVDWPEELLIKNYWGVAGRMPENPGEILAGSKAAGLLGLTPGSPLTLEGHSFSVAGVLESTGSEDDNVLFAGLDEVRAITGQTGRAHFAEVAALCSGCPIDDIVAQIGAVLPDVDIVAMQKVVKSRMYTIHFVQRLALAVSVILLVTACFMIALSLLASVNERKHEIGVLRSLGYSRGAVFSIFCLEALFIGLLAGLIGYLAGYGASFAVLDMLHLGQEASVPFEPLHLALTLAGVGVVSCLASVVPAWKAAGTDPSQALVML